MEGTELWFYEMSFDRNGMKWNGMGWTDHELQIPSSPPLLWMAGYLDGMNDIPETV